MQAIFMCLTMANRLYCANKEWPLYKVAAHASKKLYVAVS